MRLSILAALTIGVLIAGCSDDESKSNPNNSNTLNNSNNSNNSNNVNNSNNANNGEDMGVDLGPDMDRPNGCEGGFAPGPIVVDPNGRGGQLYGTVAHDGEQTWVTYNRPTAETLSEEIVLARVTCKGTVDVGPLVVSASDGLRNFHPFIMVHDDKVHAVWVTEDGSIKSIRYQWFNLDGTPGLEEPADITPTIGGTPVGMTVWEPRLVVASDGLLVAVSGGVPGRPEFRLSGQRFGIDGSRDGDGFELVPNGEGMQTTPTMSLAENGDIYLSWVRYVPADTQNMTPEQPERVVFGRIPAGANQIDTTDGSPSDVLAPSVPIGALAAEPGPNGEHFLAYNIEDAGYTLSIRDIANTQSAQSADVGSPNFNHIRPNIASGPDGGAVAWIRFSTSPQMGQVMVRGFDSDLQLGEPQAAQQESPNAQGFPPGLAHVNGNVWVTAWTGGGSGADLRVVLQFMPLD